MDYKDYIEEAKKYVSDSDTALDEYEEYYRNAVNAVGERHKSDVSELESSYAAERNRIAVQGRMNAKNIAQYMASRGLARSGEAEQENINASLSENTALSELSSAKLKSLSELYKNKSSELSALEKDYASKYADRQKWLESAAYDIAAAEYEAETEKQKQSDEHKLAAEKAEYETNLMKLEAELREEAEAAKRKYEAEKLAEQRAYERSEIENERLYNEKTSGKSGKVPAQSSTSLASSLVKTLTKDGSSVSEYTDRASIADYIEKLEGDGISPAYISELEFSLAALGYKEPSADEKAAHSVLEEADKVNNQRFRSYYSMFRKMGDTYDSAVVKSRIAARNAELDYCYTHVTSLEQFALCAESIGLTDSQLEDYLARVDAVNSSGKESIELGSKAGD